MLSFFKNLFTKPAPVLQMNDPDFGLIRFFPDHGDGRGGSWSMDNEWPVPFQEQEVGCVGIPGDSSGPAADARAFLLSKKAHLNDIWPLAEPHIRELLEDWPGFEGVEPRDAFYISCIAKERAPNGWEVCFETRPGLKWINFCLQIEDDDVVSNTIYT